MIYANDLWIQLPVKDLYDSLIMLASIQAARDLYKDRRDDLKDFYSKYGDFVTPIAADQEYWANNIVGPTTNVINDMYKLGIDPLRSQEGAMILSQLRNRINNADVARLKTRANNAIDWYKAMGQLRQKGLYNEDFSRFLKETPDQWAQDSMGYTSPTAFLTLKDATTDWYNNRTPRDATPDEKKQLGLDPRYKYTVFFDKDLMNIAKNNTPGWQGTPVADYYRDLAKRQIEARGEKATQDKIEALLLRNIADAQQEWLVGPSRGSADEFEVLKQQLQNSLTTLRQGKALDFYYKLRENGADLDGDGDISKQELSYYAATKNASAGGYTYDPSTGNMVSPNGQSIEFTDYRQMTSTLNRNRKIAENAGDYIRQMILAELAHVDLYNKYLKENRTGVREELPVTARRPIIPSQGMAPGFDKDVTYTYTPTTKVSKHPEEEMGRLRSAAREAKQKIGIYKKYFNSDGSVDYDKLVRAGYLNSDGSPTVYFMRELNKLNKAASLLPEDQRRKRADETYMLYAGDVPSPGTEAHKRLVADFAGNNKVKVPGLPNEMRKVNLNHYAISTIRRGDITGANVYDKDSDVKRAQQWLRTNKVEAYVDDESVNDAFIPNASGTRMSNDLFGEALVDKKYIDRMFGENGLNIKSKEAQEKILDALGIIRYEKQTTVPENKNDIDYKWTTYYSIPITKTYDSGVIQGDRNVEFRKARHGLANATAAERNSYAAGMLSTLIP